MNNINSNNTNNNINGANFRGKKMDINKEVKTLSDVVAGKIQKLASRAEREVYQDKEFAPVFEKFSNTDKSVYADEIILRVCNLPPELKNKTADYDTARWLEIVVKDSLGTEQKGILVRGTKNEILKSLNDEQLPSKVTDKIKELSLDLRSN